MDDRRKPLYSLREDDVDLEDDLNDFVIGLAERVDRLQDAEAADDYEELERGASSLSTRASELGYPALADAAAMLIAVCLEGKQDAVQGSLMELTEISRQVRLGHRGAA